ncbi:hypothetical protein F2Q68_00016173 [Brassica cretica]|uniref:Uncharacterized protein n=1 Tax=Brassica cretica TaxID=69181 RepID=A0A8S9H8N6_BRACR|nr:hypothetical protein F2Q68_00016173 [Brassica cretica]
MDSHSGLRAGLLIAFKILDAPRGFDVVAVASCLVSALYRDFWQGTFGMFDLVLGDNLVDSWNPKVGWTFVRNLMVVLTSKGTFSYIFLTRNRLRRERLPMHRPPAVGKTWRCCWDPEVEQGPRGCLGTRRFFQTLRSYLGPGGRLGTRSFLQTLRSYLGPRVREKPEFLVLQGPYSASLEETTTGTSSDFAFYRSKAGHYRVPMLNAASEEATIRLLEMCWLWRFNTGTCAYEFWEPRYALGYTWVLGSFDNILSTLRKCLKSFSVYLVLWTEARFGAGVRTSSCGNLKTGVLPGESEDLGLAWQQDREITYVLWPIGVILSQQACREQDVVSPMPLFPGDLEGFGALDLVSRWTTRFALGSSTLCRSLTVMQVVTKMDLLSL